MNAQRAAEITEKSWKSRAEGVSGGSCGWCNFADYYCKACPIPVVFGASCTVVEVYYMWHETRTGSVAESQAAARIYDTLRTHRRDLIAAAEGIEARK